MALKKSEVVYSFDLAPTPLSELKDFNGLFLASPRVDLDPVLDDPGVAVAVSHEELEAGRHHGHGGRLAEVGVVGAGLELKTIRRKE